jgi:diaminopimelate epimerase
MQFRFYIAIMTALKFIKMNGLGNDFVVLDGRYTNIKIDSAQAQAIADRRRGIGCDQIILLEKSDVRSDIKMSIRNSDGTKVEACGNACRCIANLIMDENNSNHAKIETPSGIIDAKRTGNNVTINMGPAFIEWQDIPLSEPMETLSLEIAEGPLRNPVAVGIGNPHAVFFVDDLEAINLKKIGPIIEHHSFYPNRTNVSVAQVLSPNIIRLRVWERGAGLTLACGTGACATLVAAVRRGLSERTATVELDGGSLEIEWGEDNNVIMSGLGETSFTGTWTL